jgi:hypothetical protein
MPCLHPTFCVCFLMLAVCLLAIPLEASGADDSVAGLARQILDDKRPDAERHKIIADHPELSAQLIQAMVADLPPDDPKEEYRRIPWIWRVAVAAGKRNNSEEIQGIIGFSLPAVVEPLRDWQAVVLGGGIINGIGLTGAWADESINHILAENPSLQTRWHYTLKMAAEMADNEKVFKGTRYDALRIIGLDTWNRRGAELFRYLIKGIDDELQQGSIGGFGDMRTPYSAQALLSGYSHYNAENRGFVIKALLRDDNGRAAALLDALEGGVVKASELKPEQAAKLTAHGDAAIRTRAAKLFSAGAKP